MCHDLQLSVRGFPLSASTCRQVSSPIDTHADLAQLRLYPTVAEHHIVPRNFSSAELHTQVIVSLVRLRRKDEARTRYIEAVQKAVMMLGVEKNRPAAPPC